MGQGVQCGIGPCGTQVERGCGTKATNHVRMQKNHFTLPRLQALGIELMVSVKFSSVTQFTSVQSSCSVVSILCDPMNHSMQGLPIHHQLPESI